MVTKLRLGVMHKIILPHFVLRRTKKLIADELPSKRDLIVFCPLASRQIQAYQAFIRSEDVEFVVRRDELCDCKSDKK
jgi:SNF2 family DNA or RNA helicase